MMEPRLKKLEAIAGTPKTFFAFSIPMASAASETRRMKGNMIRVSRMVRAAFSGGNPGCENGDQRRRKKNSEQRHRAHENQGKGSDLARQPPGRLIQTVTCNATDSHTNSASKTFKVTVVDTTPPVLSSVPADKTVEANSFAGSIVDFVPPTAVDLGEPRLVTCAPARNSTFALGDDHGDLLGVGRAR